MKWGNPYFSNRQKINLLQRWILVHSYIYYTLNESFVTDYDYDMNCKQLAEMMLKYPKSNKQSRYYLAYVGFDGSTGFDLMNRLVPKEKQIIKDDANMVYKRHRR